MNEQYRTLVEGKIKPKYRERKQSQCHFVYHKPHVDLSALSHVFRLTLKMKAIHILKRRDL